MPPAKSVQNCFPNWWLVGALTANVQAILHARAGRGEPLEKPLEAINQKLLIGPRRSFGAGRATKYLTILALVDRQDRRVRYVNAGQVLPLLGSCPVPLPMAEDGRNR
jgi:hypothetical protein